MIKLLKPDAPPVDRREILRYASAEEDPGTLALLDDSIEEVGGVLNYSVAYCELSFTINGDACDFEHFKVVSNSLARALIGARRVFVLLATVGLGLDRLINKYSATSPSRALMLSAIGTERVEALLDESERILEAEYSLKASPRFSPGYGDLPLSLQGDIFKLLAPQSRLGVYLNNEFIMTPSKSVTAFLALK